MSQQQQQQIDLDDCAIRLSAHQKTNIDIIRESVPKPPGYLPPKYLPTWELLPLEQKLPALPAPPGTLEFTRGSLGKTLLRKNVIYSMTDPMNRERVPTNKYEVLHDPTTRVNENAHATQFLQEHGIVNQKGKVICSLQEFNRYRLYLATLYNDQVREKIHQIDDLQTFERETAKALLQHELMEKGKGKQAVREARVKKAKEFVAAIEGEKHKRLADKVKLLELRKAELQEQRLREQSEKSNYDNDKRDIVARRVQIKRYEDYVRRKQLIHESTLREMKSAAARDHIRNNKRILNDRKMEEWYNNKMFSAAERLQREKEVQDIYETELKKNAIRRQKRVEKFRQELPIRNAKRKAAKERLDNIVRKYAHRWLHKVRQQMKKRIDEQHESLWYSANHNTLKESVKYLYVQSGYEKLDDVVMNILKFKEALKRQMMLDDEEDEEEEDEEDYRDEENDAEEEE